MNTPSYRTLSVGEDIVRLSASLARFAQARELASKSLVRPKMRFRHWKLKPDELASHLHEQSVCLSGLSLNIKKLGYQKVRFFHITGLSAHLDSLEPPPRIKISKSTLVGYFGYASLLKSTGDRVIKNLRQRISLKIAMAKEAARNRNLSAIARRIARMMLDILAAIATAFVDGTLEGRDAELTPRVLSPGGKTGLFPLVC